MSHPQARLKRSASLGGWGLRSSLLEVGPHSCLPHTPLSFPELGAGRQPQITGEGGMEGHPRPVGVLGREQWGSELLAVPPEVLGELL